MKAFVLSLIDLIPGSLFIYRARLDGSDDFAPRVISRKCDLLIDGFPRCANTYVYYQLQLASRSAIIAHHLHSWQQYLFAAAWGKPAYRLIREPDQAVSSIVAKQGRSPALAYFQFSVFYYITNFLPNRTLEFEDVTSSQGLEAILKGICEDCGLNYTPVDSQQVVDLLATRTNHKNSETHPLDPDALGFWASLMRRMAKRAYLSAVDQKRNLES